jgi:tetratricopeptide (TPR) repeat protein
VNREVADTDEYQRIRQAYAANSNILSGKGRGEVRSIVRQAGLLTRDQQFSAAEQLLLKAMEGEGRKQALWSELGQVYAAWKPRRAEDARHAFRQSISLNKGSDDAFVRWCRMELELKEFTKATVIATEGLVAFPKSFELTRWAGAAFSSKADELRRQGQPEAASDALAKSTMYYWSALDLEHPSNIDDREADAAIYRGLLHNYRHTLQTREILEVFSGWSTRHPADETMALEIGRFLRDYPRLTGTERQDLRNLLGPLVEPEHNPNPPGG